MIPPVLVPRPVEPSLVWRLIRLIPSTSTRWVSGYTAITLPVLPRSPPFACERPVISWTVSPFLILIFGISEHLRRQRNNLHELLVPQFPAHRAEDARTPGVAVVPQNDGGILVEPDVRAVRTATLLDRAHDDRLDDVTLLHVTAGDRVLHRGDDDVTDAGVTATRATEHPDAE